MSIEEHPSQLDQLFLHINKKSLENFQNHISSHNFEGEAHRSFLFNPTIISKN